MSAKLLVLRNGKPLFEYFLRADDEDTSLPAQANIALAAFRRLNPTVSLFDPEISVRFEKG